LTFIWYNTYTPKESSLSTAFPVSYFGVVSIKAITVALITSRERSSQLCSRRMRFSTSESLGSLSIVGVKKSDEKIKNHEIA
jgi:hypothetical protein